MLKQFNNLQKNKKIMQEIFFSTFMIFYDFNSKTVKKNYMNRI